VTDVSVYNGAGRPYLGGMFGVLQQPKIPKIKHETMFTEATHVNLVDGISKHRNTQYNAYSPNSNSQYYPVFIHSANKCPF